jgi:peptidoglycan/LPS O-acetylase OafA/YrhL
MVSSAAATSSSCDQSGQSRSPSAGLGRFAAIDVLRGLSILAVVVHHINLRIRLEKTPLGPYLSQQVVSFLGWNGANGVFVFFAISGFLITTTCLRRWHSLDHVSLSGFYRLRFARIAPCLIALLMILSSLHLLGLKYFVIQHTTLPRALTAAFTFHVNWLESVTGYLPGNWDVLWSLSNEEMFYLLFPVLCVSLRSRKLLVPALLIFVVAGPLARTVLSSNDLWRDYGYLSAMDAIALGCLAALLSQAISLSSRTSLVLQSAGATLAIFIVSFKGVVSRMGLYRTGLDITLLALGACLILIAISQRNRTGSRWTAAVRWFGRNSYEVYLTHMFVVFGLHRIFELMGSPYRWSLLWYAAIVPITGVLGAVVARYFSEPLNRRLRPKLTIQYTTH